jgi:hypothetical protein
LYRHYKGGLYEVIDTVRHSETAEAMTLYRALYGQRGLWVRPAAMFLETVEINGVCQARFSPQPGGSGQAEAEGVDQSSSRLARPVSERA